jgi:hypothetical protein
LTGVVIDAATALAWCFPDESSEYADGVLVALKGKTLLVPSVWSLEIANAVLAGERTKRLLPEILRFTLVDVWLDIVARHGRKGKRIVSHISISLSSQLFPARFIASLRQRFHRRALALRRPVEQRPELRAVGQYQGFQIGVFVNRQ